MSPKRGKYSARTSRWLEFEGEGSPQSQKPKTSTPTSVSEKIWKMPLINPAGSILNPKNKHC